jgi:hypothetical protein
MKRSKISSILLKCEKVIKSIQSLEHARVAFKYLELVKIRIGKKLNNKDELFLLKMEMYLIDKTHKLIRWI